MLYAIHGDVAMVFHVVGGSWLSFFVVSLVCPLDMSVWVRTAYSFIQLICSSSSSPLSYPVHSRSLIMVLW